MKILSVSRLNKIVVFEKDEMSFAIRDGERTDWSGRMPTPAELSRAFKQYFAIMK
jgi:hypothetical protein